MQKLTPEEREKLFSHDRLQQECYNWFFNTFPALRKNIWAVTWPQRYKLETAEEYRIRLKYLKNIGMLKGVLDLHIYYKNCLYIFDLKKDHDALKPEQIEFIAAIERQGGKGYEIRSVQEFQKAIEKMMQ